MIVMGIIAAWSISVWQGTQAQGAGDEIVPEPNVQENHKFNESGSSPGLVWKFNEQWGIVVKHGNVLTLIGARNLTQNGETWIDYQYNIQYMVGSESYIAELTMNAVSFVIGNETIMVNLTTCEDFEVTYSTTTYNGTVPELECNVAYHRLHVYPGTSRASTFELTLRHHIHADWNETDVKVEALFDLSNTSFYALNGTEYSAGEHFDVEMKYSMRLTRPNTAGVPIAPTGYTNESLEYNITQENGAPISVSKLKMTNYFAACTDNGTKQLMGYSSMVCAPISQATHGFPDLTYKETKSIKSDPEIIAFHNRVTKDEQNNAGHHGGNPETPKWGLIIFVAVVAIGVTCVAILVARKKKTTGK